MAKENEITKKKQKYEKENHAPDIKGSSKKNKNNLTDNIATSGNGDEKSKDDDHQETLLNYEFTSKQKKKKKEKYDDVDTFQNNGEPTKHKKKKKTSDNCETSLNDEIEVNSVEDEISQNKGEFMEYKKKRIKSDSIIDSEYNATPKSKKRKKKNFDQTEASLENNEIPLEPEMNSNIEISQSNDLPAKPKKKKKSDKNKSKSEEISENNDLPGKLKKKNKMHFKSKLKEKLNCKNNKLKTEKNAGNEKVSQNTKISAKPKENTGKFIVEDGVKYKLCKNGLKKPWFDFCYEENNIMTKYQNYFVKREAVLQLEELKTTLKEQNVTDKKIKSILRKKEKIAHSQLNLELMQEKIKQEDNKQGSSLPRNLRRKLSVHSTANASSPNQIQKNNNDPRKSTETGPQYEENNLMTEFLNNWILRENLRQMQALYDTHKKKIVSQRKDGNNDPYLTPSEELKCRNLMKPRLRKENFLLKRKIGTTTKGRQNQELTQSSIKKKKKPGRLLNISFEENDDVVKYNGFYIKREAAERLNKLKEQMTASGASENEIRKVLHYERRKEERILKNENKLFCYICMRIGHLVSKCPQNEAEAGNPNHVEISSKRGYTANKHEKFDDLHMNLPGNESQQKPKIIKFDD